MEQRVSKLEDAIISIDGKLTKLGSLPGEITEMKLQLAEIKGQLSQMPKAMDFVALRGDLSRMAERTANLPSTWQLGLFAVSIVLAIFWKSK